MLVLLVLELTDTVLAQPFIPRNVDGMDCSQGWVYLPNRGQVFDLAGTNRSDVRFHSVGTLPSVYAMDHARTAVTFPAYDSLDHQNDAVCRIDMMPTGEAVRSPEPILWEPTQMKYNFYETHTPQGVTGVTGGLRVIYEDIYPSIDYHILSNAYGPKFLFVVRPGGDPADLFLQFDGQDSIGVDYYGTLKLYVGNRQLRLNQAWAYQQIGNTVVPVVWTPNYQNSQGSALVTLNFGTYNPQYPLIFQLTPLQPAMPPPPPSGPVPEWCTYLPGATQEDFISDLAEGENGYVYYTGHSKSTSGLPVNGGQINQPQLNNNFDAITGKFNQYYETVADADAWMTYYGDYYDERARSLAYDPVNDRVAFCGLSNSSSTALNFDVGLPTCDRDDGYGMLGVLNALTGTRIYGTRFPAILFSFLEAKDVDYDTTGDLCVVGKGDLNDMGSSWPYVDISGTSDYFSISYTENDNTLRGNGFLMRFNSAMERTYSTALGGPWHDEALSCKVDDVNNVLYVGGFSYTANDLNAPDCPPNGGFDFPICPAGGFIKDRLNWFNDGENVFTDGFIIKFDLPTMHMAWSTYLGGALDDRVTDIDVDGDGNIYAVGFTDPYSDYGATACGWGSGDQFPPCANGQYFEAYTATTGYDHFICRFDPTTAMTWSTLIQGNRDEFYFGIANTRVSCDDANNVFLYGSTLSGLVATDITPVDILTNGNYYSQLTHADLGSSLLTKYDTYVAGFSPDGTLFYSSYLGGPEGDFSGGLEAINGRLYISGGTECSAGFPIHAPTIPGRTPYLRQPSATVGDMDAFLAQLQYDITLGLDPELSSNTSCLLLYPNPAEDLCTAIVPRGITIQSVEVFDPTGRKVHAVSASSVAGFSLRTAGMVPGLYLVRATTAQGMLSSRFLKR